MALPSFQRDPLLPHALVTIVVHGVDIGREMPEYGKAIFAWDTERSHAGPHRAAEIVGRGRVSLQALYCFDIRTLGLQLWDEPLHGNRKRVPRQRLPVSVAGTENAHPFALVV